MRETCLQVLGPYGDWWSVVPGDVRYQAGMCVSDLGRRLSGGLGAARRNAGAAQRRPGSAGGKPRCHPRSVGVHVTLLKPQTARVLMDHTEPTTVGERFLPALLPITRVWSRLQSHWSQTQLAAPLTRAFRATASLPPQQHTSEQLAVPLPSGDISGTASLFEE